jgi:hypothetical protein
MIKFDVLNRFYGTVQFSAEIECGDDAPKSVKLGLAVKWAIANKTNLSSANLSSANLSFADLSSANLSSANLSFANLSSANLRFADLSSADLSFANLSFADLSSANLRSANLSFANLSSANLSFANLSSANLSSANLSSADMSVLLTDIWVVYIQPESIRIGCRYHTAKDWFSFSDAEISAMDSRALEWWHKWKPAIQVVHAIILGGAKK